MAGKKPINQYNPFDGLSEEEIAAKEKQLNIFGLSTGNQTKVEPEDNNENIDDGIAVEEIELLEEDVNPEDSSELLTAPPTSDVKTIGKKPKKNAPEADKTGTTSGIDTEEEELIFDSISKEEAEALERAKERDKQNAEITAQEEAEKQEEAMEALEEAQAAQSEIYDGIDEDIDIPGLKDEKGKKKKGKKATARSRLLNNNDPLANFRQPGMSPESSNPSLNGSNDNTNNDTPSEDNTSEGSSAFQENGNVVTEKQGNKQSRPPEKGPIIEDSDIPIILDGSYITPETKGDSTVVGSEENEEKVQEEDNASPPPVLQNTGDNGSVIEEAELEIIEEKTPQKKIPVELNTPAGEKEGSDNPYITKPPEEAEYVPYTDVTTEEEIVTPDGKKEEIQTTPPPRSPLNQEEASQKYIQESKDLLEKYNEGSKVVITESGSFLTYKLTIEENGGASTTYTAMIDKANGSIVQSIGDDTQSVPFDNLVLGIYNSIPEKPTVYDGNQIYTTEQIAHSVQARENIDSWNIEDLNKNLLNNYGSTYRFEATEKENVFVTHKGTDSESYVTFHPVSHRVIDIEYKSSIPSQETKNTLEKITQESNRFAETRRSEDAAYLYLNDLKFSSNAFSSNNTPIDSPKKIPQQSIPGVTTKQISNGVSFTSNTQYSTFTHNPFDDVAPPLYTLNKVPTIQGIYSQRSNVINPYTTHYSGGNMAMTLRNMTLRHTQMVTDVQQGLNPVVQRMMENNNNTHLSTININITDTGKTFTGGGTANIPQGFYSSLNPSHDIRPIKKKTNFAPVVGMTKSLAITSAYTIKSKAMQNSVGEGMQAVAMYTVLPFQMVYKSNPFPSLIAGLNTLPNYKKLNMDFAKNAQKLGLVSAIGKTTLSNSDIANVISQLNQQMIALGFSTSLSTPDIQELIKNRVEKLNAHRLGKIVLSEKELKLIELEITTLKTFLASKKLVLDKVTVSAHYIEFFKQNGVRIPSFVTDLTNKRHLAALKSALNRELSVYDINIAKLTPEVVKKLLEKFPDMLESHKAILEVISSSNFQGFMRSMSKGDRRAMYFLMFLQKVAGQNDTITGAVKMFRTVRYAEQIIRYTTRAVGLARMILGKIAHKRGWDKVTKALKVTSSDTMKGLAMKPLRAVERVAKKAVKSAGKTALNTALGRIAQNAASKVASTKIAQGATRIASKISQTVSSAISKKLAIQGAIKGFLQGIASKVGAVFAKIAYPIAIGVGIAVGILLVIILIASIEMLITDFFDKDRMSNIVETTYDSLIQRDEDYLKRMRDEIKLSTLQENGEDVYDFSNIERDYSDATVGFYDPDKEEYAKLSKWGWGDSTAIPDKNGTKLKWNNSSKSIYDANNEFSKIHNRGYSFTFTDRPKVVYYCLANGDVKDVTTTPKEITFKSNAREILATTSIVASGKYSNVGFDDSYKAKGADQTTVNKMYQKFFNGYAYDGIYYNDELIVEGEKYTGEVSTSLWAATHGYQTAVSELYACNGCKGADYTYYCNSDKWKNLTTSTNNKFVYNKDEITPYNEKGCFQHTTSETYNISSGTEKYCGQYHKSSTGEYILCCEENRLYYCVGHTTNDTKGLLNTTFGYCDNCTYKDLGEFTKVYKNGAYAETRYNYSTSCSALQNVLSQCDGANGVVWVLNDVIGREGYAIPWANWKPNLQPECCGCSQLFFINDVPYIIYYCKGHQTCANKKTEHHLVTKTIVNGISFGKGYKVEILSEGSDSLINVGNSIDLEVEVYDYCAHYKKTDAIVVYDGCEIICDGHCYGHNDCRYCTGHVDKLVNAYIISDTNPKHQTGPVTGKNKSTWDSLPFNTIFSADTCSGPASIARSGFIGKNNGSNIFKGNIDTWSSEDYLLVVPHYIWCSSDSEASTYARQDVQLKSKDSWLYLYDINPSDFIKEGADEYAQVGVINEKEWKYLEKKVVPVTATDQQKAFVRWAVCSAGKVPYAPNGLCEKCDKYYTSGTRCPKCNTVLTNVVKNVFYKKNNFGKFIGVQDSAGRQFAGLTPERWLNWCYNSAFTFDENINPTAPKLSSTNSVPFFNSMNTEKYKYIASADDYFIPENAQRFYCTYNELKDTIQAGDIIVLKKACQDCGKTYSENDTKDVCTNIIGGEKCGGDIIQNFGIFIGWSEYEDRECPNCSEKYSSKTMCPDCHVKLTNLDRPADDSFFVVEMSPRLFDENVVVKRYNNNDADVSKYLSEDIFTSRYVFYRFLN